MANGLRFRSTNEETTTRYSVPVVPTFVAPEEGTGRVERFLQEIRHEAHRRLDADRAENELAFESYQKEVARALREAPLEWHPQKIWEALCESPNLFVSVLPGFVLLQVISALLGRWMATLWREWLWRLRYAG